MFVINTSIERFLYCGLNFGIKNSLGDVSVLVLGDVSKIPIGMGTKWFIFCRVFLSNGIIITKNIIMTYNFFLLWINL